MTSLAHTLRTLADLIDQGHPADLISVGEHVTVVATPISAARWQELTPNGLLDVDGAKVSVTVVPLVSLDVA
ncbi:hypothetical protein [uncultured Arthrobacter sp.]|uniref:hypothetical protein n=1 Tax=uncultured Arthrobacter sp. TaxID=114050 RepID=UPI0025FC88B2|nr:hypothetical protein [uncultured Arthrobacter sp.]